MPEDLIQKDKAHDVVIVASADDGYAMPMTVMLHSALHHLNTRCRAHIYVLDAGITPRKRARATPLLQSAHPQVTLHWITPDLARYAGLNLGRYGEAALLRLMIPDLIDPAFDRALYLDSDIVVEDDLSQLWMLDLGDAALWAVPNASEGEFDRHIRSKFPDIDAPTDAAYLNSGVLLMNLGPWRAQQVSERTTAFLKDHSDKLSFPDQDALNVVNAGRWKSLERRWNAQVHNLTYAGSARGITHYTSFKPWRRNFTQHRKWTFFQAYLRSGWDNTPVALGWTAIRWGEQILRHNIKRIKRRLPGA